MDAPSLNLVVLRCRDLDRTAAFYQRLGLRFERHRHGSGPEHHAAEVAGATFELYPLAEGGASTTGTRVGFKVASVEAALSGLLAEFPAALVSAAKESPWGKRAVVQDPEGHRVELTQAF